MADMDYEEIDKARKTLELRDKATLEEIKGARRRLSKKWHPDKCREQDKELGHNKMKEINKAYRTIMKYIDGYNYSFAKEKVAGDSPEERWKAQFGGDPHWGKGWGN